MGALLLMFGVLATGVLVDQLFEGGSGNPDTPENDVDQTGSSGTDLLQGTSFPDTLDGGAGDDLLMGNNGDDKLYGDEGDDVFLGEAGDDLMRGGSGMDVIFDDEGADTIYGDTGDDIVMTAGITNLGDVIDEIATSDSYADVESALSAITYNYDQDTDLEGDRIVLGYGDDIALVGSDDSVTGGEGDDIIAVGSWIEEGHEAVITDFNPSDDTLVVEYDNTSGGIGALSYEDDGDGNTLVSIDGQSVAILLNTAPSDVEGTASILPSPRS